MKDNFQEQKQFKSKRLLKTESVVNPRIYDLISHHPTGLPLPHVKIFTAQMVAGLEALSQAGMTHSDIKPENILYHQRRNRFCITDADCCAEGGEQANERKLCASPEKLTYLMTAFGRLCSTEWIAQAVKI